MNSNSRRILLLAVLAASVSGILANQTISSVEIARSATEKLQVGDFRSAADILQKSVRLYPDDAELWNLLGIVETELNQQSTAKQAFERGLYLAPNSTALNENAGLFFYRIGNYETAKSYLSKAIASGSRKPGVRFSLAAAKLRTGEPDEALSDLRELEPALSNVDDYWMERGRAELAHNDASAAAASFDRALALAPGSSQALNGAAYAAEKQGLDEKALLFLIQARKAAPQDVSTLIHFGAVCIRRDLGPDALDALGAAYKLQPSNNTALYLLARANISVENWQTAHDLFADFARRVPSFAPTYYAMGWLDIKLDRVQQARTELEHSLALAPGLVDAAYELAQLEIDDGQLGAAEQSLQKILQREPRHAKANMAMGDLMMRKGNLKDAQEYLESAVQQDASLSAAHYKLSIVLFREHRTQEAEKEKALAATLDSEANRVSRTQFKLATPESANFETAK